MTYAYETSPKCQKQILKACKKNILLEKIFRNKIEEILENPGRYKSLRYDLAGIRRVHILEHFVLTYEINEEKKTVVFLFYGHHDEAYKQ